MVSDYNTSHVPGSGSRSSLEATAKVNPDAADHYTSEKPTSEHLEYQTPMTDQHDHDLDHDAANPHIHFKTWLVLLAISSLSFVQLANIIGAAAFSRNIAAAVGGSGKEIWLNAAVSIMTAVFSPIFSRGADLWGRKWWVVGASITGFVGCMVTARATSMEMAIAGEVVAGLAYGSQPLAYAIPSEIVHRKYRTWAQAGVTIAGGLGAVVGLLMGGGLMRTDNFGFRIYFYICSAFFAVTAIICGLLYNPLRRPEQDEYTTRQKLAILDWVGYILFGGSLVTFIMAFTWAENPYAWNSAQVLAPLVIGIVLAILLFLHQKFIRKDGLFDRRMWSLSRTPAIALLCLIVEGIVFNSMNNYLPQQIAILYGADGFGVPLRLSITYISAIVLAPIVGWIGTKFKSQRILSGFGFLCFTAFGAAMCASTPTSSMLVWGIPVLAGGGLASVLTCLTTAAQISTPPEMIAPITGLVISLRSLGGAFGSGIATAIFNSKITSSLFPRVAAALIPLGIPPAEVGHFIGLLMAGDIPGVLAIPGMTPQILGIGGAAQKSAFSYALKYVWIFVAAVSAAGVIGCIFIQDDKSQYTVDIDAPVEKEEELFEDDHHRA